MTSEILDFRGLRCPLPILRLAKFFRESPSKNSIVILTSDPATVADFTLFCQQNGHQLISCHQKNDGTYSFTISLKSQ
jgi:tRNA 2-thiouridine synthesizing protein A